MNGALKIFLLLILILGISACTQASGPSNRGLPPGKLIDIKNGTFNPDNLTVPLNTTVTWANHDANHIDVVADDGSFDSGEIYPNGYEYIYIFLQSGVYGYHSKENFSMHGQVVVANANGTLPKVTKPPAISPQANKTAQANQTAQQASRATGAQKITLGLVAKSIAFNTSKIAVPAGAQVTVNFDNQDSGVPHNLAVYQSSSATSTIFKGQIITGSSKTTYTFTAPSKPGTYYFQCDVHPTTMNGQFVVISSGGSQAQVSAVGATAKKATATNVTALNITAENATATNTISAGQSKSISLSLIAKNIAFDKKAITIPASSKVTINFDNQDSGVPHNFAAYENSAASVPIFKGQIITGPNKITYTFTAPSKPGTYYFQCDVHPTQMNGQFVVK